MEERVLAVDQIGLRRCTEDDAEALAVVGAATFLDAFAGTLPGASIVEHCRLKHTAENYREFMRHTRCRIWLAETLEHKGPVGYSMVTEPDLPILDPHSDDLELRRIYLLSRFHGGSAGKRLMQTAVEGARQLGASRLFLGVYGGNARALAFYKRSGFKVVGTRKFRMGFDVFDDLVLGRDITPFSDQPAPE